MAGLKLEALVSGKHRSQKNLARKNTPNANGAKGTIIFTNASAAFKGFPSSGAFAMACHAKSGLALGMAKELMPQRFRVANVPIDAAIGRKKTAPCTPADRNDGGRLYGQPGLRRGSLFAAASPASVNLSVRSRATVGRETVTRTRGGVDRIPWRAASASQFLRTSERFEGEIL